MIYLKTEEEISKLKASNQLVGRTLGELAKVIRPGINTLYLDRLAEEFIRDNHAEPGFKGYGDFPYTLCVSVNENVVHGFPSNYVLKEGDIVSIDCGTKLDGYYGDSAYTFCVGEVDPEVKKLLKVTKESLYKGIDKAIVGNRLGDIGSTIQTYCENNGYSVVRELVGHGVGRKLHEDPEVPNYGHRGRGSLLKKGLVIAIEPMICMGKRHVVVEEDGWTIRTRDRMPSAHFEHTIAVRSGKSEILSSFDFVEEVLNKNQK